MSETDTGSNATENQVVIVASHNIVRHALKQLLGTSGKHASIVDAESADRAVEIVKSQPRSAFIIVPDAQGIIGAKLVKQLRGYSASARLVVVALPSKSFEDADATIGQNHNWGDLIAALEHSETGTDTHATLVRPLRRRAISADTPEALSSLSAREREVFFLLANGVPNRLIAKQLFVSPRTIETHRARVIRKLGLSSTASIVRYAIRHNLLSA